MPNTFREALEAGEFVVTCEMIPGRGACEDAQERLFSEARDIYATGRVHAISVTDNPGGNPALLADAVGVQLLDEGITPLVHFTCKDRNRNQIMSQLYALQRAGVENLLLMTGDYQVGGWMGRSRPVFDLDSVQVQMLVRQMNEGLVVQGRKGLSAEKPTGFFAGGVVNPFKYREGEAVPQYLKMEKKVVAGARFLIGQVGYDPRKLQETRQYLCERGLEVPLIANVFVLTRGAARLMRSGSIAGCYVSDALMDTLEREAAQADKGRPERAERAAQMVAIAKGLGYAGVHIGGFGVDAALVERVLGRAEQIGDAWRDYLDANSFGKPGGYYVYAPELDAQGAPTGLNAAARSGQHEPAPGGAVFKRYRLSRVAHWWMLTLGKRFERVLARVMDRRDAKRGVHRAHGIEHTGKALLYGCVDCGDCGLEAAAYSCPMAACPKSQRNGPCGGSYDGWCEVYPHERYCIWYMAFHRAARYDEMWRIDSFITPPNHWEYHGTSPWSNYTHERDNAAYRIPVSLGLDGAPGGKTAGTDEALAQHGA